MVTMEFSVACVDIGLMWIDFLRDLTNDFMGHHVEWLRVVKWDNRTFRNMWQCHIWTDYYRVHTSLENPGISVWDFICPWKSLILINYPERLANACFRFPKSEINTHSAWHNPWFFSTCQKNTHWKCPENYICTRGVSWESHWFFPDSCMNRVMFCIILLQHWWVGRSRTRCSNQEYKCVFAWWCWPEHQLDNVHVATEPMIRFNCHII